MRPAYTLTIALFLVFLTMGCSSGERNLIEPSKERISHAAGVNAHCLWGYYEFTCDPEQGAVDVTPLRSVVMHLNALPFLEPPPLLYLTLEYFEFNGNQIDCIVGLRHPFLGLTEFTGFDVSGILISNGSVTGFDDPDLRMAGQGNLRLLNPDGWTRWWNPLEFPHDGTIFGYVDGLLGAPDSYADYNCTLNGYKYFCDDLGPDDDLSMIDVNNRGMFSPGQQNTRCYLIDLGTEGLIFNYAIDACWEFPQGDYPWTAPDDFSPNANRPEPYRLSIYEINKTLIYDPEADEAQGEVTLLIDVYDWFDANLNTIYVECGDIFTSITTDTPIDGGLGYSTYQIDILDAQPTTAVPIELFITAACQDIGYQELLPGKQVASYFKYIMDIPEGEIEPEFPCGDLYFEDNFDSYSNGQNPLPSPWFMFWSGYLNGCRVTNEQSYSAPHSWRSCDSPHWMRTDAIPMTREDHFCYEARVMLTNTRYPAYIGFQYYVASNASWGFATLLMRGDDYTTYHWYYVYAEVDCVENHYSIWVDEELKVDSYYTDETREYSFTHFIISTNNHWYSPWYEPGNGVVFFDDVKLWVDQ